MRRAPVMPVCDDPGPQPAVIRPDGHDLQHVLRVTAANLLEAWAWGDRARAALDCHEAVREALDEHDAEASP